MEPLKVEGNDLYPRVVLDPSEKRFIISGKSMPIDAHDFYISILEWIKEYIKDPLDETEFHFHLDYFNTPSIKRILFIIFKLKELKTSGNDVTVKWHYREDDDDLWELGRDLSLMTDLPFTFVEHPRFSDND